MMDKERDVNMARLKEICGVKGINVNDFGIFIVENKNFEKINIKSGDCLVYSKYLQPSNGDFAIISHSNKLKLVWILGKSLLENALVCSEYIKYPISKEVCISIPMNKIIGKLCDGNFISIESWGLLGD